MNERSLRLEQNAKLVGRIARRVDYFCCAGGVAGVGRCGLSLDRLRLQTLQHGTRAAALGGIDRQRDRRDHERHRRPCGGLGKSAGRAARTERRLAALTAEGRRNVAALAALQQHDDDDEETDQDVNGYDQTVK